MEAFLDYKNGTLGLIGSADEIRVVLTSIFDSPDVIEKLDRILANQETTKMFEDDVIAKLTAQKTIIDGVKTLLETLSALIKSNPGPDTAKQAQIEALLDGNSAEISAAIVANTPGAPTTPPVEPPPVDPNPAG